MNYVGTTIKLVLGGKTIEVGATVLTICSFGELWGSRTEFPTDEEWAQMETAMAADIGQDRAARFISEVRQALLNA